MDGLTLGYLARELDAAIKGGRVDKITQPERDEIRLAIRGDQRNVSLLICASAGMARAHLTETKRGNPLEPPMFCMLLRKHLSGGRVACARQIDGDRILEICVDALDELGDIARKTIVCEFMGKYSNIILVAANGRIIDSARHVTAELSRVREVLPGLPFEHAPSQGKTPYTDADEAAIRAAFAGGDAPAYRLLADAVSGLSRQTAMELILRASGDADARPRDVNAAELAARCAALLRDPPAPQPTVVIAEDGKPFDVTAFPYRLYEHMENRPCATLSEAMDAYYAERDRAERIAQKSTALRRTLRANLERCEKKLALQNEALEGGKRMDEYRLYGELLAAAAPVAKGARVARVINYYDPACAALDVPIDPKLSLPQNAQRYFKLYQKARSAQKLAAEQKALTETDLTYFEGQMENLDNCTQENELNEIREELENLGYVRRNTNRRQLKSLPPSKPMRFESADGFPILVGKNNLQNDKLTQTAAPNEVWLHAKDMPGSHVVIVGEHPPERTIAEAALLAARFSKGRNGSKVPVDYTLRKYVRKPAGGAPGFVLYTHQHTLYMTPTAERIAEIKAIDD